MSSQWDAFQKARFDVRPDWRYVVASGAVVLATYSLLIEVWRRILAEWKTRIGYDDAARIWLVSSLGKYLPGKQVWLILMMGKMAEAVQVPPAAAAGSSIVNVLVNLAMGFVVAIAAGWRTLARMTVGHEWIAIALGVAMVAGVVALPSLLPVMISGVRRITRRELALDALPRRAIYIAIVGNLVAWVLYGWSFQLLVHGVLGRADGRFSDYVAAYAASYVIGYLVFVLPAGVGVREAVQTAALATMGLNSKEALAVAVASRLWLTVLEIVPGLIYAARGPRSRSKANR